ncbi:hypothetical protein M2G70_24485 [Vibrio vulnificus]|nr:hypothetical protein [Vibrio vulnificus]MCU8172947.1 hypothetical protein [Vibrio vulnificus]MCU8501307.1 hypothetical protein [Vibrio vulnificus]MCU8501778.1 hypothetical protein [Vibrio vulnificus]
MKSACGKLIYAAFTP